MYDEMKSFYNYYSDLHPKMTQELYDETFKIANLNFNLIYTEEKTTRLFSDGIARNIVEGLKSVANGTSSKALRLFSGHDTGLYSHMLLLNISSLECHL